MSTLSNSKAEKISIENLEQVRLEIDKSRDIGITFAVAGNAGYGKTTTVNTLFNVVPPMPVGDVKRGTDLPYKVLVDVENVRNPNRKGKIKIPLTIYDLPGLGDIKHDLFFSLYKDIIPYIDVILWVLRADVRVYKLEIDHISALINLYPELKNRIVLGINYAEFTPPKNWNYVFNQPSKEQKEKIAQVKEEVESVRKICGLKTEIAFYSAEQAWRLEELFSHLIDACPDGKKWVFSELKLDYRVKFLSKLPEESKGLIEAIYQP